MLAQNVTIINCIFGVSLFFQTLKKPLLHLVPKKDFQPKLDKYTTAINHLIKFSNKPKTSFSTIEGNVFVYGLLRFSRSKLVN